MRRQRTKYKHRNADHAITRARYLLGKVCQVCRRSLAVEVHHIAGRNASARDDIAARYEDPKNWLAVCRPCHIRVDKETPALVACAAKMMSGGLDLNFLKDLRSGRRFSFDLADLHQALDDLEATQGTLKKGRD